MRGIGKRKSVNIALYYTCVDRLYRPNSSYIYRPINHIKELR